MKLSIVDACNRVEDKMISVGNPDDPTASKDEMKYMLVGTDIGEEEFTQFIELGLSAFTRNLHETGGSMNEVLSGLIIQALMTGRELGLNEANDK